MLTVQTASELVKEWRKVPLLELALLGMLPLSRWCLRCFWREGTGFRKVQLDREMKE